MLEENALSNRNYFYKVTIAGKNLENPLDEKDYTGVEKALKDVGYEILGYIFNPVFIGLKMKKQISDSHRQALEGICTIVEDESMKEEIRHVD